MNIWIVRANPANPEARPVVPITVDAEHKVSGLFDSAPNARACYVFAHGAGAGMRHPFMAAVAKGLTQRGISTLRYLFPYMERGGGRPDPPALAQATVRAAVVEAQRLSGGLPLFAGGKSYGGRMTSQAQAESPLPDVRGLIFLGFPLHPPGKPSDDRAKHLSDVQIPMFFLQGTSDEFAKLDLLRPVVQRLGARATLKLFADANHSFRVPKSAGRSDAEVMTEMLDDIAQWIDGVLMGNVGKNQQNA